jgi:hypothetical protein
MHFWVTESEYEVMQSLARERGESVAGMIRRLVRAYRVMYPQAIGSGTSAALAVAQESGPEVFG